MAKKVLHVDAVWQTAIKGMDLGAYRKTAYRWIWNAASKCEKPVTVELSGRPSVDKEDRTHGASATGIDIDVRCRKCKHCLAARAALWRHRAQAELANSTRAWFGTLTLSPERHAHVLNVARHKSDLDGDDFAEFSEEAQFAARHGVISKEITRYLKRMRKESGAPLRYLIVAESHETGLPHYHALVHESEHVSRVGERTLSGQWTWGFSKWRLAKPESAGYVCKYLSKCSRARVRASLHYGNHALSVVINKEVWPPPLHLIRENEDPKKTTPCFIRPVPNGVQ
jgi:hypothetical protein